MLLNLLVVAAFTVGSLLFVDQILIVMNTPQEIYGEARIYLFLILAGIPVTMVYTMGSAVLRSMDNSVTPLAPMAMGLITGSQKPEVLESGARFIRVTLLSSPFLCTLLMLRNTLQGMGHKVVPLFASATEMVGKVVFVWTMVPRVRISCSLRL